VTFLKARSTLLTVIIEECLVELELLFDGDVLSLRRFAGEHSLLVEGAPELPTFGPSRTARVEAKLFVTATERHLLLLVLEVHRDCLRDLNGIYLVEDALLGYLFRLRL